MTMLTPRGVGRCRLSVSVMPNAKRTEVDGTHGGALRVRLAAPPIDGRANEALVAWLADELGVPRRDLAIVLGMSSRRKVVELALDEATVAAWLGRQLPQG